MSWEWVVVSRVCRSENFSWGFCVWTFHSLSHALYRVLSKAFGWTELCDLAVPLPLCLPLRSVHRLPSHPDPVPVCVCAWCPRCLTLCVLFLTLAWLVHMNLIFCFWFESWLLPGAWSLWLLMFVKELSLSFRFWFFFVFRPLCFHLVWPQWALHLLIIKKQSHRHREQTCGSWGWGRGMDRELGVSRCKLLYTEWINNKVLL